MAGERLIARLHRLPVYCLTFVCGVGVVQLSPQLPSLPLVLAAGVVTAGLAWRKAGWRRRLLPLLALLVGVGYAGARAEARLGETLPPEWVWKDITVEGVVSGFPDLDARRTRFDFDIERIHAEGRTLTVQLKARLSDYLRDAERLPEIAAGNRLRFVARLRPPRSSANPHGFDYAGYLFANGIRLAGYVRQREAVELLEDGSGGLRRLLYERIAASDAAQNALIAALVIGDRSRLTDAQWKVLRHTGTAHLVSVSGVHIGFIFLMAAVLMGGLWRRRQRLTAALPAQQAAIVLALPAALAYALLAGFGVPVQRSFFMATTAALILFLGGAGAAFAAVILAMAVVVLLDPWAVLAPGFWLSFLLTAAVIAAVSSEGKDTSLWWRLGGVQLMLSLVAIPLTLWFFNEASLISPVANLLAVPVVGFVVLPLSLAGAVLGDWCWLLAGGVMEVLWVALRWLGDLPYAVLTPAAPPLWLFALAVGGGVWLLLPRGVPWRCAGALPLLAMLLYQPAPPAAGEARVSVLDIGQGTAVIIQTQNHALVYDTGRPFGGRILAGVLRASGIGQLDKVIVSHDDYDHRGGLERLTSSVPAAQVIASDSATPCERGMEWDYDGVAFRFLHPAVAVRGRRSDNDDSCVLLVQAAGGMRMLFTGDLSDAVEMQAAAAAEVLMVGHHGSRHSSSMPFLRAVQPQAAVVSAAGDAYGHPHKDTLARLDAVGAEVYRTDRDGAIIIRLADTLDIIRWRNQSHRYWH